MLAYEVKHMNDDLKNFFEYFGASTANLRELTNSEASSHALALRKFFKAYIKENNKIYSEDSEQYIDRGTYDRIYEFMDLILNKITAAPGEDKFQSMKFIDEEELRNIINVTREFAVNGMKLAYESEKIHNIANKYNC